MNLRQALSRLGTAAGLAASLAVAPLAAATPDANGDREIRQLISFVAGSQCTFIRNGDAHPARDAAEHLRMKYGKARSRLGTPEQFIEHVATRSFFTGEEYRVQCPGRPEQASASWLRQELQHQRMPVTAATR